VSRTRPTYALVRVQQLMASPLSRVITGAAVNGAGELGLDEDAIVECVLNLDSACFHKTMPAEKRPGLWQDVYRPTFEGLALYVKVQIVEERPGETIVIISFKQHRTT
jgi:motility quorum-sensing regulator / GCU-specific mRNA interferase toxin